MNTKNVLFVLLVTLCVTQVLAACGAAAPAAPTSEPTTAPPPALTATPEPPDPAEIVQSFWGALEKGNIDAAMIFVAEDVKCRGSCYLTGKDSFRSYVQGMADRGNVTKVSDVIVDGDTVTYFYKVFRNDIVVEENTEGESMQILDGKIILWNNLHF